LFCLVTIYVIVRQYQKVCGEVMADDDKLKNAEVSFLMQGGKSPDSPLYIKVKLTNGEENNFEFEQKSLSWNKVDNIPKGIIKVGDKPSEMKKFHQAFIIQASQGDYNYKSAMNYGKYFSEGLDPLFQDVISEKVDKQKITFNDQELAKQKPKPVVPPSAPAADDPTYQPTGNNVAIENLELNSGEINKFHDALEEKLNELTKPDRFSSTDTHLVDEDSGKPVSSVQIDIEKSKGGEEIYTLTIDQAYAELDMVKDFVSKHQQVALETVVIPAAADTVINLPPAKTYTTIKDLELTGQEILDFGNELAKELGLKDSTTKSLYQETLSLIETENNKKTYYITDNEHTPLFIAAGNLDDFKNNGQDQAKIKYTIKIDDSLMNLPLVDNFLAKHQQVASETEIEEDSTLSNKRNFIKITPKNIDEQEVTKILAQIQIKYENNYDIVDNERNNKKFTKLIDKKTGDVMLVAKRSADGTYICYIDDKMPEKEDIINSLNSLAPDQTQTTTTTDKTTTLTSAPPASSSDDKKEDGKNWWQIIGGTVLVHIE